VTRNLGWLIGFDLMRPDRYDPGCTKGSKKARYPAMSMKKVALGIFGLICLVSPLIPAASGQVVVAVGHPHHHYHHRHCYYRHGHRHCYYR
jgi:hypothetical protein